MSSVKLHYGILLVLSTCIFSCVGDSEKNSMSVPGAEPKEALTPVQYKNWVESPEHSLIAKKEFPELEMSAQYRPWNLIALNELKSPKVSKKQLDQKISEFCDLQYFNLKISSKGTKTDFIEIGMKDKKEYSDRVSYFSFKMQKDISLVDGKDTLPCSMFLFERTNKLTPYGTFLLGFPINEMEKQALLKGKMEYPFPDKTLLFNDQMLTQSIISLTIKGNSIKNIPTLITE